MPRIGFNTAKDAKIVAKFNAGIQLVMSIYRVVYSDTPF